MTNGGFDKNLYIVCGIPGTGKSTYIQAMFPETKVVSSDIIRRQYFQSLRVAHDEESREKNNDLVFALYHTEIRSTLDYGRSVVADATNLTVTSRAQLRAIASSRDADAILILFTNVIQAMKRNRERDADSVVPEAVMTKMIQKYWATLKDLPDEQYATVIKIASVD